ncbi:3-hydroxy acid dehydrogenase/malonic semialdehyde reductase [Acinetobacter calcoaceticus]|uniref:3-hydroxy acid dehydrogenase/malonic semialdehyde reductase n=1 Tax=Acinetobacter calcoaceticus TaxID=471 RepID=A0A4R1XX21_ACICA|nr:3-hydroxy acid dehydrogenase/malonic semialdehyde reductase [Acinetobacter calcoaceticus]
MLALVTGASSGFGASISKKLIENGYKVIGVARRADKLLELKQSLGDNFLGLALDLCSPANMIEEALSALEGDFNINNIDLLVNNAGLALGLELAYEANLDDWYKMIDTNIKSLVTLTRIILPTMVNNRTGLIINMGSIAGTYPYPGGNTYGASKAFVDQFSLNLRADLAGTGVRVSNVEPGLCGGTEFSVVRFKGDLDKVNTLYEDTHPLQADDIAETVYWIASQPHHININKIEIMPVSQSFNALKITKDQN